jgi:hypothetical protein
MAQGCEKVSHPLYEPKDGAASLTTMLCESCKKNGECTYEQGNFCRVYDFLDDAEGQL